MKIIRILLVSSLLLFIAISAQAYDGITYYGTKITNKDRYNSHGKRLRSVRAILRQDRANFYRFGRRDSHDQGDGFFHKARNRSLFESANIRINKNLANRIVYGRSVYITVYVFDKRHMQVKSGLPPRGYP